MARRYTVQKEQQQHVTTTKRVSRRPAPDAEHETPTRPRSGLAAVLLAATLLAAATPAQGQTAVTVNFPTEVKCCQALPAGLSTSNSLPLGGLWEITVNHPLIAGVNLRINTPPFTRSITIPISITVPPLDSSEVFIHVKLSTFVFFGRQTHFEGDLLLTTVLPPELVDFTLDQSEVIGGNPVNGMLFLDSPAPDLALAQVTSNDLTVVPAVRLDFEKLSTEAPVTLQTNVVLGPVALNIEALTSFGNQSSIQRMLTVFPDCNGNGIIDPGDRNDRDADGVADACDNCPDDPNPNQADADEALFAENFDTNGLGNWSFADSTGGVATGAVPFLSSWTTTLVPSPFDGSSAASIHAKALTSFFVFAPPRTASIRANLGAFRVFSAQLSFEVLRGEQGPLFEIHAIDANDSTRSVVYLFAPQPFGGDVNMTAVEGDRIDFRRNVASDFLIKYGSPPPGDIIVSFRAITTNTGLAAPGDSTLVNEIRVTVDNIVTFNSDGVGDVCDLCPDVFDLVQLDSDTDGFGDGCDVCPGFDDTVDVDADGVADGCDNCPMDSNPGQGDRNNNGRGDACEGEFGLGDFLPAPIGADPDMTAADPMSVDPVDKVFYHDVEKNFYAIEDGVVTIQWLDSAGAPVGDPEVYGIRDQAADSPSVWPARYLLDYDDANVLIDSSFDLTIRYNSTIRDDRTDGMAKLPPDIHVLAGIVKVEDTAPAGKVVFQYDEGPGGPLVGFEVVELVEFGTPDATEVLIGRRLPGPPESDCRVKLLTNTQEGGVDVAWQRGVDSFDVYPLRPEDAPSDFVAAWYQSNGAGNCWPVAVRRHTTSWPLDPQTHVVDASAPPSTPVVDLPVGAGQTYCKAEVMYQEGVLSGPDPFATINAENRFTARNAGYSVVRFDILPDLVGANCGDEVTFEVVRSYDHLDTATVFAGAMNWDIGTQIDDAEHDGETPRFEFGYLHSGQAFAFEIHADTGQIFAVNSADVHGSLEVWWFEPSRMTQDGNFAEGVFWPHKVVQYDGVWPMSDIDPVDPNDDPILIASRVGAGSYPDDPTTMIYSVGTFGAGDELTLTGWNANDEHAILLASGGSLRAFAVRDDDPWSVMSGHPYVLVTYLDENALWRMGVHEVMGTAGGIDFDYTDVINPTDPAMAIPVVAGQPIDPLFPVNLASPLCLDFMTNVPLTTVTGDALWVDGKSGIWAVEETDDGTGRPSSADIFLWENWAADAGCQPWRDFGSGTPTPIVYRPNWPPVPEGPLAADPPECVWPDDPLCARPVKIGQSIDVSGQCGGITVLHNSAGSVRVLDLTFEVSVDASSLSPAEVVIAKLPPHLASGEIGGGGGILEDRLRFDRGRLFFRGIMSERDKEFLFGVSTNPDYATAVEALFTLSREQLTTPVSDPATKFVTFADAGTQPGWLTLAFQNDPPCVDLALPISVEVWRVDCPPVRGRIQIIQPQCVFSEKLVLQHSVDAGGRPEGLVFHWQWANAPEGPWNDYNPPTGYETGEGLREVVIEGASPFTLADSYWRVRYRGFAGCPEVSSDPTWPTFLTSDGTRISEWSDVQLAEGWIKRVVRGLNPFDQRIKSFHVDEVTTYVSMIRQAGMRFEAPIALNCDPENINAIGLIEAYETVLGRGRQFSIDVGVSFEPANLALLLVTSKISDLYMLLGNEAFADGMDPTIGLFAEAGEPPPTFDPHAVFAFENQVPTILDEELTLLRGRDEVRPPDFDLEGRLLATVYNRLPWNFTSGDGQVAYANNYQFTDVVQARETYPQGHGDAWGHYLTAMRKFYTLLRHPVFEWIVSSEAVLVAGQPVRVGFQYERKFAAAAAAKARTGAAITALTFRRRYTADPTEQDGYPDADPERAWGVTEWGRRAGQGAYLDWVVANALIDDDDAEHEETSIQKIDRTTVTDIREIASSFIQIQSIVDQADAGLNPLGLATNVVPFGLSPTDIDSGKTHFDQVFERATRALNNAVRVFDYANENTQRLRATQDRIETFNDLVDEREIDFKQRLIEIFGRPYPEDIGLGGAYASGYDGPDIFHFDYVDLSNLAAFSQIQARANTTTYTATFNVPTVNFNADPDVDPMDPDTSITEGNGAITFTSRSVDFNVSTDGLGLQTPAAWTERPEPGEIQLARTELLQTLVQLDVGIERFRGHIGAIQVQRDLITQTTDLNDELIMVLIAGVEGPGGLISLQQKIFQSKAEELAFRRVASIGREIASNVNDALPRILIAGFAIGSDPTSPARAAISTTATVIANIADVAGDVLEGFQARTAQKIDLANARTDIDITDARGRRLEQAQIAKLRQLVTELPALRQELQVQKLAIEQAAGRYRAAIGKGLRLLEARTAFRQRTARNVSQFRYRDMAFRVFRNDALQKYRAQFDLAARYAFLAAKAYDYETNLLGTDRNSGREFMTGMVKERVLGRVDGGTPLPGNGLAGRLAAMADNFDVLRGQLGFNSPAELTATFSLRWEFFRIANSPAFDEQWRQALREAVVPDLNQLVPYRQLALPLRPLNDGAAVPAIVIPFSTTIHSGLNFFGWPSQGDELYPTTFFAIKLHSFGVRFGRYPGAPLNRQVEVYLLPIGADVMRVPTRDNRIRIWNLIDQTLPVPNVLTTTDFTEPNWTPTDGLIGGASATVSRRLYPTLRARPFGEDPDLDRSFMLTGRTAWNTQWVLIIPALSLQGADPENGIDVFINGNDQLSGVNDIKLLFNSYGYAGAVAGATAEAQAAEQDDVPPSQE